MSEDIISMGEMFKKRTNKKTYYDLANSTDVLKTGFNCLDSVLQINRGDVVVIASKPRVEISALGLNIVRNTAVNKKRVLYMNTETNENTLFQNLLAIEADISLNKLRNDCVDKAELENISRATAKLSDCTLYVLSNKVQKIMKIKESILKLQGLDLVVIDSFQSINAYNNEGNDYVFRKLVDIAEDLNVPLILISKIKNTNDKENLSLEDLGDMVEIADTVLLFEKDDKTGNLRTINIAKQKNKVQGKVSLKYNDITGRCEDIPNNGDVIEVKAEK